MATPTQRMQLRYVHAQPPLLTSQISDKSASVDPFPSHERKRVDNVGPKGDWRVKNSSLPIGRMAASIGNCDITISSLCSSS